MQRILSADTLYICNPPYAHLIRWRRSPDLPPVHRAGLILASHEPSLIARLAAAAPSALILVEVRPGQSLAFDDADQLHRAGAAGFVVTVDAYPSLTAVLTAARHAANRVNGEIAPRLRLMGYPLTAPFDAWLEVLSGAEPVWTATDWTVAMGESIRTLERRCAGPWHLPTPRRWIELVRVIHAVQALQANQEDSVESVLARAGFRNVRRSRELVRRICGAPPATVRRLIGWYWILQNWSETFWVFASPVTRAATLPISQAWGSPDDPGVPDAAPWPPASQASHEASRKRLG